jgi:VanZ family protein
MAMMSERVRRLMPLLWTWGPVAGLMLAIFVASAQPKNPPPPGAAPVYFSGMMPVFSGMAETLVKKGAHAAGYALLALAFMRAFRSHSLSARRTARLAFACAMAYALTDELHQAFVPGRHASALDIALDATGAVTAILIGSRLLARAAGKSKALPGVRGEHTHPVPKRQTQGFR